MVNYSITNIANSVSIIINKVLSK